MQRSALDLMRRHHIPSMCVAVVGRDRVHHLGAYGWRDLGRREPTTTSTAYMWFSMTKVVTATAAMRLAVEGRLDLDAPFDEYLPVSLRGRARGATSRQLLTHTAGLSNPLPLRWVHTADSSGPAPAELLAHLLTRRRAFRSTPGGRAHYSNVGYLALGEVLSTAAGMPYTSYIEEAVLAPAGMSGAGFTYRRHVPVATGYLRAPRIADPILSALLPAGVTGCRHGRWLALNGFLVDGPAYGGLISDIGDAARFVRLHLNDGVVDGNQVLPGAVTRAMRVIDHPGSPFNHGIGWFRTDSGPSARHVEHLGAGAGFCNVMRLQPDHGVGIVIMSNTTARYDAEPLLKAAMSSRWPDP